jgi:hypothetical protein
LPTSFMPGTAARGAGEDKMDRGAGACRRGSGFSAVCLFDRPPGTRRQIMVLLALPVRAGDTDALVRQRPPAHTVDGFSMTQFIFCQPRPARARRSRWVRLLSPGAPVLRTLSLCTCCRSSWAYGFAR